MCSIKSRISRCSIYRGRRCDCLLKVSTFESLIDSVDTFYMLACVTDAGLACDRSVVALLLMHSACKYGSRRARRFGLEEDREECYLMANSIQQLQTSVCAVREIVRKSIRARGDCPARDMLIVACVLIF